MNTNSTGDYSVALHEASHAIAADFYRIPNYPELTPGGFSRAMNQSTEPGTAGLCHIEKPYTAFQDCVISFAGILGQCMFATPPGWAPPFRPSEKTLRDFHMMVMHQLERLSDTDRLGILGDYRHSWRACRSAFRIVRKHRARIIRLAKAIGGRVEKPVPMPEKFPAALADFNAIIIGGSDAETKLRAFIHDQGEKWLSQPQFALGPELLRQHVDSYTTGRMDRLKSAGFPGPDEWTSMARTFKAWTKTAKIQTDQIP